MAQPNKFPTQPHLYYTATAQISTANTAYDGSGTLGTLLAPAAGTSGFVVTRIEIKAAETTTAGMVRIFLDNGSNDRLIAEISVSAVTPGASTATATGYWAPSNTDGLAIPAGYELKASTHNAEDINVIVYYRAFE